jgi:hypothetical protein
MLHVSLDNDVDFFPASFDMYEKVIHWRYTQPDAPQPPLISSQFPFLLFNNL